jgi:Co/Zn/Cd efflux system component
LAEQEKSHGLKGQQEFILLILLTGGLSREQIGDKFHALGTQFGMPPRLAERTKQPDFLNKLTKDIQDLMQRGLVSEKEGIYYLTEEGAAKASERHAGMLKAGLKLRGFFSSGETAAKLSVLVNLILAALKLGTGLLVNSMGLIADGLDSLTDVLSSLAVFLGIKYKRGIYSTVFIILMMFAAGITIGYQAISRLISPQPIDAGLWAILAAAVSGIVCYLMSVYQNFIGKRSGSLSLLSQSIDSKNHVFYAGAVLTGIIFARFGILIVDSLVGIAVAILILKSAIELTAETIRVGKGGELNLSKFRSGYEKTFEQYRLNYFKFWTLFEMKSMMSREELIAKFNTTFSTQEVPVASHFGFNFASGFEFEKHLDFFLDELMSEGAITKEQDRYVITKTGISNLNKKLKNERHR